MPVTPTYPGVYIEELPSAVRTITAVSTSVTAFAGDWVEAVDDAYAAHGEPAGRGRGPARRPPPVPAPLGPGGRDGVLSIEEGECIDLEDGVQVWFAGGGAYRPCDYWVVAARTLTGDVEWPRDGQGRPLLVPPHGPSVHYAPLAWVGAGGQVTDLRLTFPTLTSQASG